MTRYLRISFVLLLLLIFAPAVDATDVIGPVSGTWTLSGSPYNVIGEIYIPSNQSLTIEPGVQVIFQWHYKFQIYGQLQAIGAEADTILFTTADTSNGWHGLRFYDINTQPDSSRLVYCKITYGRSSSNNSAGDDKHGGAIFGSNSGKLKIEHCLIALNKTGDVVGAAGQTGNPASPGEDVESGYGGAIYLDDSGILMTSNTICFNRTGDAFGGEGG